VISPCCRSFTRYLRPPVWQTAAIRARPGNWVVVRRIPRAHTFWRTIRLDAPALSTQLNPTVKSACERLTCFPANTSEPRIPEAAKAKVNAERPKFAAAPHDDDMADEIPF
jgi:hypothetical protein